MDKLLKQTLKQIMSRHIQTGHDGIYYKKPEIDNFLSGRALSSHAHTKSDISDFPTSLPASDVYSWAKSHVKPTYTWDEITNKPSLLPTSGGYMGGSVEMQGYNIGSVGNIWINNYGWLTSILDGKLNTSASCNKNWNWSGQGGQPTWVWGGEDGTNMYVYNPSNFNVNHATYAGNLRASSTGRCLVVTDDNYLRIRLNGAGENGVVSVGSPNYRFAQVYVTASSISTSDRNLKDNINPLTDKHLEFFMKLIPVSFTFKNGTSGRTHIGFISQDVEQAMTECGLTDLDFAGFCKDKRVNSYVVKDEETGEYKEVNEDILDEDGNPVYIYSLRYEEFIALIAYALQRTIARVDEQDKRMDEQSAQIAALEKKLAAL